MLRAARRRQTVARDLPRPLVPVDVHDHELLTVGADPDPLADQRVRNRVDRVPHRDGRLAVDLAGLPEAQRVRQAWQPVQMLVLLREQHHRRLTRRAMRPRIDVSHELLARLLELGQLPYCSRRL